MTFDSLSTCSIAYSCFKSTCYITLHTRVPALAYVRPTLHYTCALNLHKAHTVVACHPPKHTDKASTPYFNAYQLATSVSTPWSFQATNPMYASHQLNLLGPAHHLSHGTLLPIDPKLWPKQVHSMPVSHPSSTLPPNNTLAHPPPK